MATGNKTTLMNMQSKLQGMGSVPVATIGEPSMVTQDGTVAIIPISGRIDVVTLANVREYHTILLRRYAKAFSDPVENIEFGMDQWRADILEDIFGDFDLGGTIAYAEPTQTTWTYGYQDIGRGGDQVTKWRILDITLVYRLDDNAALVA